MVPLRSGGHVARRATLFHISFGYLRLEQFVERRNAPSVSRKLTIFEVGRVYRRNVKAVPPRKAFVRASTIRGLLSSSVIYFTIREAFGAGVRPPHGFNSGLIRKGMGYA